MCLSLVLAAAGVCRAQSEESNLPAYADRLRPQIEEVLRTTLAPGAVVVVKSPKGNWEQAFGTRTLDGAEPVGIDDHFRVGSVTKTWTGTVILQLAQEGKLKLSDPISKYVAQVPNGGKITIEHLLAMRSGLANYTADPDFQRRLDSEPNQVYWPEKLLSTALRQRPSFAPGEKYQYSNTNTVLLGMVIRKVTKRPVALEMQERLFKPLGLLHTFLPSSNDTRLPRPFTHGYQYGPIYEAPGKESGNKPMMRDATTWNTSWGWTAGMGISKARELAVFAQHLVGGDYLTPEWQQQRLESCLPANPDNQNPNALHYGWGIGRIGNYYGHTGELPGYNTFMVHDLASKTTIVVWTSLSEGANKRLPAIEIGSLIIAELDKSAP